MCKTLAVAREHGGELIRLPGGFWTWRGCEWSGSGPAWFANASTINALIDRGRLIVSEWQEGRNHQFPVSVRLAETAAAASATESR
jgi:hypothetical protein